jgi:hypothetical protein
LRGASVEPGATTLSTFVVRRSRFVVPGSSFVVRGSTTDGARRTPDAPNIKRRTVNDNAERRTPNDSRRSEALVS